MQYRIDRHSIEPTRKRLEVFMLSDRYGDVVDGGNFTGPAVDAFGRARVSDPYTLFESVHRYGDNGKWNTYLGATAAVGATAAIQHQTNESTIDCIVGTHADDIVIRETKTVFPYQPGKSLLFLTTFVMNELKENLRQRVGYFGDKNGIYLETDGTDVYLVERSYVSGSVTENKISQANWNIDPLDGTGSSKVILDLSKGNILFIDVEWLGIGTCRVGFIIDGQYVIAHKFHHANIIATTYLTTATLPIRYEIENLGTTSSSSILKQICSTVISEGGYNLSGLGKSIARGVPSYQTLSSTAGQFAPTISLKLNNTFADTIVLVNNISILMESNSNIQWKLLANATLTGDSFVTTATEKVHYDVSATDVTGGTELASGFLAASSAITIDDTFSYQLKRGINDITRSITGTTETITLAAAGFSPSKKIATLLGWTEI